MRCSRFVAWRPALLLCGLTSSVCAAEADKPNAGEPRKSQSPTAQTANPSTKTAKQQALLRFDTNGDGKLDEAERQAARMAQLTQKRLAKTGPKTDAKPDGSLSQQPGMGGSTLPNPYASGGNGYMPNGAGNPPNARPGAAGYSGSFYYWGGYYSSDGQGGTFGSPPNNYPGPPPGNFPPPGPPR